MNIQQNNINLFEFLSEGILTTYITRKWEYVFVALLLILGTVFWVESGKTNEEPQATQLAENVM